MDEPSSLPFAGSSTEKLEANESVSDDDDDDKIRWRSVPSHEVYVRGADYLQSRKKVPSLESLYECAQVDFLEAPSRVRDISSRVQLPEASREREWHVPDVFVVTLSLPTDTGGSRDDGPNTTIVLYFKLREEVIQVLENLETTASPLRNAVRLFDEWCRRAPNDPQFQARFKLIPMIQNLHELGLPSWISRWNGKPVLIKRSGTTGFLYAHDNCMEMEVSFHPFPWATKQAFRYLRDLFPKILFTFAFVIEGREVEELPEVVLGASQLHYVDPKYAMTATEFLGGGPVRSSSVLAGDF